MTFGQRLRSARKEKKLTQKELASKIQAAHNSISNWENDQNMPDPETIQNLCWALDVQPNYFFNVETPSLLKNIIPIPEMQQIPLLGAIACGAPILAAEHIEEYIDIPKHIHADFALTCKGDSMINARIFDGDIVYIRQQEMVENGEIAAVLNGDGEATLKRVRLFDDHISLEPENPMHRPQTYWNEEMNSIRIIGKAVAFTSAVR